MPHLGGAGVRVQGSHGDVGSAAAGAQCCSCGLEPGVCVCVCVRACVCKCVGVGVHVCE